jgi:predicted ester cyclase
VAQYLAAFSHTQSVVEDQVAEGDRVVVRLTFTGTHTGPWMGLPPTGKPVTVKGMALYRLQDGKIVEQWTIGDTFGLLRQLGAVAEPMPSGEPPAH